MTDEQTPSEKAPTTPETRDISDTPTNVMHDPGHTFEAPEASETAVPAEASEPTEPAAPAEQAEEPGAEVTHDSDAAPETAPAAEATQPVAPAAAAAAPPLDPPERPIFESDPERSRRGVSGRTAAIAGVIAAAAVLGGGIGAALTSAVDSPETVTTTVARDDDATTAAAEPASRSGDLTVAELYRETAPSVVEISVSSSGGGPGEEAQGGQGSGFVLDTEGHVVTNQHVVDGADSIRVTFTDGSSYDAELVGADPSTDLAVIDVDAPEDVLEPLDLGDSDALEVGEEVVAMGSPYGLQETVTTGIVSALHRQITAPNGYAISDAIQTDAAINPGNSGGPLLNLRGEVVGVNSQIETGGGGNDGVGFAVPSNTVESIAAQLIEDGSVEHAYLGVTVETIPADVAEELGEAAGVALVEVRDGTPAAEADLEGTTGEETAGGRPYPTGGDVVTEIDGEAVDSAEELQARIDAKQPGDELELTVVRGGETRTVTVELGTRPD